MRLAFAHYTVGLAAVSAVLCAGCGSSATKACGAAVPGAVAAVVGASSAEGKAQAESSGYAKCVYKATAPGGGQPEGMSVTVMSGPGAYVNFTTTITHLVQFPTAGKSPRQVAGVGRQADWLRGPRQLLAADAKRFVTVQVLAHGAGSPSDREAAKRVAQAALRG